MARLATISTPEFGTNSPPRTSAVPLLTERAEVASNARPLLAPEERRKREEAVRFADASIGLEGFVVSPAAKIRAQRFIEGEIDLAEFVRGE